MRLGKTARGIVVGLIVLGVGALVNVLVNDGTVIRLLGGVACRPEPQCGTYTELKEDLEDATEKTKKAETALSGLGERLTALEANPAFPDDWAEFTGDYIWRQDGRGPRPSPQPMIPTDEGFCFLTRIEGTFEGDREWAAIVTRHGQWVLEGGSGRPLAAHARCWKFPQALAN